MDYNFTARVENQFDKIAEGKEEWTQMMKAFDKGFEPTVDKVMNARWSTRPASGSSALSPERASPCS